MIVITIILSGLIAGLLYGYACSVNPGLSRLSNKEYLNAMQSINAAILNPAFFISFIGLLFVFPATAYILRSQQTAFYFLLAAMIIYITGVFGVTMFANVPLNNRLAGFNISTAPESEINKMRALFETRWNKYHFIRTVASVISFTSTIIALIKIK